MADKLSLDSLEFEGGNLVKIRWVRPEYMGGDALIRSVKEIGGLVYRLREALMNIIALQDGYKGEDSGRMRGYHVAGNMARVAIGMQKKEWSDPAVSILKTMFDEVEPKGYINHISQGAPTKPKAHVKLWAEQSKEPVNSHGGPAVATYWTLAIDGVILGREFDRRYWCIDREKFTKIEYAPRNLLDLFNSLREVFDAPDDPATTPPASEAHADRIMRLAYDTILPKPPGDHDQAIAFKANAYDSLRAILYPDAGGAEDAP